MWRLGQLRGRPRAPGITPRPASALVHLDAVRGTAVAVASRSVPVPVADVGFAVAVAVTVMVALTVASRAIADASAIAITGLDRSTLAQYALKVAKTCGTADAVSRGTFSVSRVSLMVECVAVTIAVTLMSSVVTVAVALAIPLTQLVAVMSTPFGVTVPLGTALKAALTVTVAVTVAVTTRADPVSVSSGIPRVITLGTIAVTRSPSTVACIAIAVTCDTVAITAHGLFMITLTCSPLSVVAT